MFYTDNPERDADRYERQQEKGLEDCPICEVCGEPIQDDFAYLIGIDEWIHDECIGVYRRRVH